MLLISKNRLVIFVGIIALLGLVNSQDCQNKGIKILSRYKYPPYTLQYLCLCPYIYYGKDCGNIREVYCFISDQKILNYNPKPDQQQTMADLSFMIQCFLKKYSTLEYFETRKITNNSFMLPLSPDDILADWKQNNYYIDKDYQIVWANQTRMFNNYGQIIRNSSTQNMTDQQILDSFQHYKFQQVQQFFGFPLYSSKIYYKLNVQKFSSKNQQQMIQEPLIRYTNISVRTLNGNQTKYIGNFRTVIKKQWQQYKVTRLELKLWLNYGFQSKYNIIISHRLGMNSGKWLIFDPNYERGNRITYDKFKVPPSLLVILGFLAIFILIRGSRQALRIYKNWKNRKNLLFLNQQQFDQYDSLQSASDIKKPPQKRN